jgi:4-alpha-glucanotransferase
VNKPEKERRSFHHVTPVSPFWPLFFSRKPSHSQISSVIRGSLCLLQLWLSSSPVSSYYICPFPSPGHHLSLLPHYFLKMILSPSPLLFSANPIAFSISPFPRSIRCKYFAHPTLPSLKSCATSSPPISAVGAADLEVVITGEDLPEDYDQMLPVLDPSCRRRAGILLHPTSLHGPHGIGDLGDEALRFLDWLHSSGCSVWQVQLLSMILN